MRSGASVLSVNPWAAGSTPRKIEAWTGSVHGGVTVRALKHDAPSSARVVSAGMVARVMWRGANPSIDTTSTGERRAVVPAEYDCRSGIRVMADRGEATPVMADGLTERTGWGCGCVGAGNLAGRGLSVSWLDGIADQWVVQSSVSMRRTAAAIITTSSSARQFVCPSRPVGRESVEGVPSTLRRACGDRRRLDGSRRGSVWRRPRWADGRQSSPDRSPRPPPRRARCERRVLRPVLRTELAVLPEVEDPSSAVQTARCSSFANRSVRSVASFASV